MKERKFIVVIKNLTLKQLEAIAKLLEDFREAEEKRCT